MCVSMCAYTVNVWVPNSVCNQYLKAEHTTFDEYIHLVLACGIRKLLSGFTKVPKRCLKLKLARNIRIIKAE